MSENNNNGGNSDEPGKPRRRFGANKPVVERIEHRPGEPNGLRIAKAMARAGLCSRREAERWITDGRVKVNGRVLHTPAFEVRSRDRVLVDGEPLPEPRPVRLWRYYKPVGRVTTHSDPEGRPTVFDALPPGLGRVISVGRLDFNTEGLLLLTSSGPLARHLELPATGLLRRYRVRARGTTTQAALDALKDGVEIDGISYGPIEATLDSEGNSNVWLTVGLREGKNREVRTILQHLGLEVSRLIRVSYGPFRLGELEPGEVELVRRRVLVEQLGPRVADDLALTTAEEDDTARRPGKPGHERQQRRAAGSEQREKREAWSRDKPEGERGRKPFTPRGEKREGWSRDKPEGERGRKPFTPRGEKREGWSRDKPEGERGRKPFTPRGEKREGWSRDKPEGERGRNPFTPRGEKREAWSRDKPEGERGRKPFTPRGEKREAWSRDKPEGERSRKPFTPRGEKREGWSRDKPEGERGRKPFSPRGEKREGWSRDKPEGERGRKPFAPRGEKRESSWTHSGKPGGAGKKWHGKPAGKPGGPSRGGPPGRPAGRKGFGGGPKARKP